MRKDESLRGKAAAMRGVPKGYRKTCSASCNPQNTIKVWSSLMCLDIAYLKVMMTKILNLKVKTAFSRLGFDLAQSHQKVTQTT